MGNHEILDKDVPGVLPGEQHAAHLARKPGVRVASDTNT